jgi:hypothetical protein
MTDPTSPPSGESSEPGATATAGDQPGSDPMLSPLVPPQGLEDPAGRKRYEFRFVGVYATLGAVLVAAIAGFAILVVKPGHKPAAQWSAWQPAASTKAKMTHEIAQHVAHKYKLGAGGGQLVAIVPSPPTVTSGTTSIAIKAIAIRKAPQSNTGIEVLTSTKSEMFNLCGLGEHCSIQGGKPSALRGRLIRREALEVALYTFKFVPAIDSIIAFMPPAPGATTSPVLFLRKENFKQALDRPLAQTLSLPNPPLPTESDDSEATTIDDLTLPSVFSYELTALQTGGAALVLDPAT